MSKVKFCTFTDEECIFEEGKGNCAICDYNYTRNVNTCVCCGTIIPEGRQVCYQCENKDSFSCQNAVVITEDVKVYRMNDCEWWASKLNKEETNEWYKKEYGLTEKENSLDAIKECDLDKEGMWWETGATEDTIRLGDSDEIISIEIINGMHKRKVKPGDLIRKDSTIYKWISFREAIAKDLDFTKPYCIASTEF